MRIFWHKCAIQGIFGGYQDHLGPSGPILGLSMFLIGYLGPWGLMGALKNIWGYNGATLALSWCYCGCTRQVGGSQYYIVAIGAIWRLFGGCQCYLEVISAIWV